jgi:hypothetical protein
VRRHQCHGAWQPANIEKRRNESRKLSASAISKSNNEMAALEENTIAGVMVMKKVWRNRRLAAVAAWRIESKMAMKYGNVNRNENGES